MTKYITERQNYLLEQYLIGELSTEEHQELENALNDTQNEYLLAFTHAFNEHQRRIAYRGRLEKIKKQEARKAKWFKFPNFIAYFSNSGNFLISGIMALVTTIREYYLFSGIGGILLIGYLLTGIRPPISPPITGNGKMPNSKTIPMIYVYGDLIANVQTYLTEPLSDSIVLQMKTEIKTMADSMILRITPLDTNIQYTQLKKDRIVFNQAVQQFKNGNHKWADSVFSRPNDLAEHSQGRVEDEYILTLCHLKNEWYQQAFPLLGTIQAKQYERLPAYIDMRDIDKLLNICQVILAQKAIKNKRF